MAPQMATNNPDIAHMFTIIGRAIVFFDHCNLTHPSHTKIVPRKTLEMLLCFVGTLKFTHLRTRLRMMFEWTVRKCLDARTLSLHLVDCADSIIGCK